VPVEELFAEPSSGWAPVVGDVRDGELVVAARVDDLLAVAPLRRDLARGSSFAAPDGVLERGAPKLFAGADVAGFVVAGCEPGLGIAEALLAGGGRRLVSVAATSGSALAALRVGRCHAAVVHGPAGAQSGRPDGVRGFHLARWRVGLAARRRPTLRTALAGRERLVQRDAGAASQQALERAAASAGMPVPAGPLASGHLEAARIASEMGGAAVTYEPAAAQLGLAFLPLETHVVELWVAERFLTHPGMAGIGELLAGRALRERLKALGGYDLTEMGTERRAA
jgi:hypothetical protein